MTEYYVYYRHPNKSEIVRAGGYELLPGWLKFSYENGSFRAIPSDQIEFVETVK
jgi:hypothetical protein